MHRKKDSGAWVRAGAGNFRLASKPQLFPRCRPNPKRSPHVAYCSTDDQESKCRRDKNLALSPIMVLTSLPNKCCSRLLAPKKRQNSLWKLHLLWPSMQDITWSNTSPIRHSNADKSQSEIFWRSVKHAIDDDCAMRILHRTRICQSQQCP